MGLFLIPIDLSIEAGRGLQIYSRNGPCGHIAYLLDELKFVRITMLYS